MKFTIQEYVRWSDVDFAGLICYGAYLRFFEFAETELFRAAGLAYGEVFERFDIWLPRVQLHCDFHSPALLDDLLSVLLSELLVLVVTLNGLLDLRDFVWGQIAAAVFALFPGVEVVIGTTGPLADNAEGAVLHALDLDDLFDEGLRRER